MGRNMSATAQGAARILMSVSDANRIKWFARLISKKALLLGVGLLLLWEILGRVGVIDDFTIPLPSSILSTFWELILDGSLFIDLAVSVKRVLVGYAIGIAVGVTLGAVLGWRSEEHTSELQSLMRISYAVFCLKKKNEYIC